MARIRDFFFGKDARIFDETGDVVHPLPPRMWGAWDAQFAAPDHDWHHHQGEMRGLREDLNLSVSDPKSSSERHFGHASDHPDWRREISADSQKSNGENEPWNWMNWLPWNWH